MTKDDIIEKLDRLTNFLENQSRDARGHVTFKWTEETLYRVVHWITEAKHALEPEPEYSNCGKPDSHAPNCRCMDLFDPYDD